ncbi:hypothetical protein HanOQP8_Chr13g0486441 [Helianthus annuus]|nr:hypothetical protein HanOQP8_Chr13g0486441 [Helianthus annuus]
MAHFTHPLQILIPFYTSYKLLYSYYSSLTFAVLHNKMANGIRFFELFNKTKIPSVGLGTWQSEPGLVGDAVSAAIKIN